MNPTRPAQSPGMNPDPGECKHARVRVVTREEDSEFVECLECGDVFESSEFQDMDIEESKLKEIYPSAVSNQEKQIAEDF